MRALNKLRAGFFEKMEVEYSNIIFWREIFRILYISISNN
jgi:hypothetical protein